MARALMNAAFRGFQSVAKSRPLLILRCRDVWLFPGVSVSRENATAAHLFSLVAFYDHAFVSVSRENATAAHQAEAEMREIKHVSVSRENATAAHPYMSLFGRLEFPFQSVAKTRPLLILVEQPKRGDKLVSVSRENATAAHRNDL